MSSPEGCRRRRRLQHLSCNEGLGCTLRCCLKHGLLHGSSVGEVSELDDRHALEVVTFTEYTDKRNISLAGSFIVTHRVTEEDHWLI